MYSIIFVAFIILFQTINTYKLRTLSQNEVLNIKNEFYISFYCKNNTCVESSYTYSDFYIEFPDTKNGGVTKYISETCTIENAREGKCLKEIWVKGSHIYTNCTIDSECLSNKCFNNFCVFNEENPIIHCDDIYTSQNSLIGKSSYMHCGKPYKEPCEKDSECSSMVCGLNKTCTRQLKGPSDSDGMRGMGIMIIVVIILIFIIILCYCCSWYKKHK